MRELPRGWRWSTVAEVGKVELGRQRHPNWHTGPKMRPYLRVANVFEDRIDLRDVKEMDFSGVFERFKLHPGDVLLNEGQTPELLGRPAIYRGFPEDVAFTNSLIRFQAGPDVTPEWALTVFRHHMHSGRFAQESRITTNIAHLSATRFKSVEFPVPPLAEQRRIVELLEDHLSRLDAARGYLDQATRRAISLLAALRSEARSGEERPVPEVAAVQGGIQKQQRRAPRENAYPFLRVANVTAQGLDLSDVHRVELFGDELSRLRLRRGDLLVVEGNGSASQIGRAALWDGSIDNCVHQNHLIRVRPGPDLLPEYLEAIWNSPQTRAQLTQVASSSSGLHTLSVSKLNALWLPVPNLEHQRSVILRLQESQAAQRRLLLGTRKARLRGEVLRRATLAAAFSGNLRGRRTDDEIIEEHAQ